MVWGPLLPSPVIRTRDVVAIQSRQRVRCRCRSRWHYAVCAIFYTTYLVFFPIVTSSFWPSLWSKILNVTSLKKVPLNDLEIQLATTCWFPQKGYNFVMLFLPLWNQLKSALGPAGNRSSAPWASYTTAWTITPPCQMLNSHTFSFYLIGFFHSEINVKELAAQPGIDPRPSGFKHHNTTTTPPLHHRDFSVLPNPSLSLLSPYFMVIQRSGAKASNRFSLLRLWAPQP